MSEVKVNKISPRTNCGTVTLGDSGDSFVIPAGATITNNGTQTGFGRTGTVNWQTGSIKTGNFSPTNGEGYFVDTSGGAVTATLPASPSAGDIVGFSDYTRTFGSNNLTIARNGSPMGGVASDVIMSTSGLSATFVYVDSTEGWINVTDSEGLAGSVPYMSATGGNTIATCGDFKVHTFTSPGTFTVTASTVSDNRNTVGLMVVAGGGAGGAKKGGGGGAGGFRERQTSPLTPYTASPLAAACSGIVVSSQAYPITVGGGGTGAPECSQAVNPGSPSTALSITSTGGGGGGAPGAPATNNPGAGSPNTGAGDDGGSGGGVSDMRTNTAYKGGGNTPPVSPPQGNPGGMGVDFPPSGGGGGGGASASGADATTPGTGPSPSNKGGNGGAGVATSITGSPVTRAGGGGGGINPGGSGAGTGGPGGGGAGRVCGPGAATAGTVNTGGGGGGAGAGASGNAGGSGGSGIVVIRYRFQN